MTLLKVRAASRGEALALLLLTMLLVLGMFAGCAVAQSEQQLRIKDKAEQVGQLVQTRRSEGVDPRPVLELMERAGKHLQAGEFDEAEAFVDGALAKLDADGTVPTAGATGQATPAMRTGAGSFEKLTIVGDAPLKGIYDPAIVYTPDGSVGWLTYSAVYGTQGPRGYGQYISTHVAKTTDHGKTFQFAKKVNESVAGTVPGSVFGDSDGYWHYEVSSMAHDPDDPGREWKMFAHKIFSTPKKRNQPQFSWITMRTASSPDGVWSEEIPLFAGRALRSDMAGERYRVADFHRDLHNAVVLSEPSALYFEGVLYLSLTALGKGGMERIFLLASDDHGQSWRYVGTLATRSDAQSIGLRGLDGSNLFVQDGKAYLLTVAVGWPQKREWRHYGTMLFEVEDLSKAKLVRKGSKLAVLKHIEPLDLNSGNHGGGQATYDPYNKNGGILMCQINLDALPEFAWVFKTNVFPFGEGP